MARVHFTQNLQRHVSSPTVKVKGGMVRELLDEVFALNPRLRGYVLDEQSELRKHMAVFIDGIQVSDRVTLSDLVPENGEVYVMQALSGGENRRLS